MFRHERIVLAIGILLTSTVAGSGVAASGAEDMHILSGVNMMSKELVLVHADEDKMVRVPLEKLNGWQPASPQHTWITADEKTVYVATDAIPPFNASIVVLHLGGVDWDAGTADVQIRQILPLDVAGRPSDMPNLAQTDANQPIMPWTRPLYTQTHGPTFLPSSGRAATNRRGAS